MYNRYHDSKKFITDPEKLQIVNQSEVYISSEENYDIVVDLEGHTADFEELKPFIAFVAQNLCELDNTAQKFDRLHSRSSQFPYDVKIVFIDIPYVTLEYWGTEENTQFHVVFEYKKDRFILKRFGTKRDVPTDWEQAADLENSKSKQAQKESFWLKLTKQKNDKTSKGVEYEKKSQNRKTPASDPSYSGRLWSISRLWPNSDRTCGD